METTKNNLPENTKQFFYKLSNYLDTKLYYFGSVQRPDYVAGKSDIDVDIFTDNEKSIISKMQHFLHVKHSDFKPIIWIIDDKQVYGYKIKYENEEENIVAEFFVYNEKFKDVIIKEHTDKFILPFYITIMLYILKLFHYTIPLLPNKQYNVYKRFIITKCLGRDYDKFIIFE
jgi:hypothetical protein